MNHGVPEVGDQVVLYGQIVSITDGIAVVEVVRTWPLGLRVPVQCGALDYNEQADAVVDDEPASVTGGMNNDPPGSVAE